MELVGDRLGFLDEMSIFWSNSTFIAVYGEMLATMDVEAVPSHAGEDKKRPQLLKFQIEPTGLRGTKTAASTSSRSISTTLRRQASSVLAGVFPEVEPSHSGHPPVVSFSRLLAG